MIIENQNDFSSMQHIGEIVANCLEYMKSQTKAGMTTLELDALGGEFLAQHGALSAPKVTYKFPGFTCISIEHDCAHGIPGSYVLKEGDLINIDVSAHKDGYFADNGQSFVVGVQTGAKHNLCLAVEKALNHALTAARADVYINSMGKAVEKVAQESGCKVIKNLGGHGVGRGLHEEPKFIPGYWNRKDKRYLKENWVIAFEPFLSTAGAYVKDRPDGWGLYVPNGYAAQKEHTVMIQKDGVHIFTKPTKDYSS